ncbi:hypothetical protein OUZ56_011085 [Daphnia magna]|uniref:Lactosylceramide n=1 Tax=Daphnia magna TaxID=35525 RepID=A0ABQ9YZA2_9CRUS|nr:hypothetical protein OUZ56_011085 [Daphnia magna]
MVFQLHGKNSSFLRSGNFVEMRISFAMKLFLFLTFFAICNSQENQSSPDTAEVQASSLFSRISQCILYRYIPDEEEEATGMVLLETNSTDNSYRIEEFGISYRYVPCRDDWSALMIVFESHENFLRGQNARLKNLANQCQIERIQYKNESEEQTNRLNEEKHYQQFNLTECLNEVKNKRLLFESEIENCRNSNNNSGEKIAAIETAINKLESDLALCLSEDESKELLLKAEMENCQNQNSMLNEAIAICDVEKSKLRSNYTDCLADRKNESLRFVAEMTDCQNLKSSLNKQVLDCEAVNENKQISLIECQTKNWTQSLETELEKCQHLFSVLNEKLSSCDTANTLLESNLTGCLNEVNKNISLFNAKIKDYQSSNYSGNERIVVCEAEKRKANFSLTGCLSEGESKTSLLEAEIDQLLRNNSAFNVKELACDTEKTKIESNFIECFNDWKNKSGRSSAEVNQCQDLRDAQDEKRITCENGYKKMVVNLTACLNIKDDENLKRAMAYAKKYQDLSLLHKNEAETCDVESRKLEANLTGCLTEGQNELTRLEDEIKNYQKLNYSLSEKISMCNIEKSKINSQLGGCLTETKNKTLLLETTRDETQNTNLTLNAKIATCNKDRTEIMLNYTKCLNDENAAAENNLKKVPFIEYIASFWKGSSFFIKNDKPSYESIVNYDRYNVARLGLFPLSGIKPLKPEFGAVLNDVLSFRYPIRMPACTSSSLPSLFIVVISSPDSFAKRDRIRKELRIAIAAKMGVIGKISFGFFLELTSNPLTQTKIEEEGNVESDIVQINIVIKTYRDSTLKMAAVFNWLNRNCSPVTFIFKVEEDVKFDLSKLIQIVKSYAQSPLLSLGVLADNESLTNREGGPRKITYEEFPWNNYPTYFNGSAYFLHGTSVLPLLACFQTTPMFPFEDVYVTGLCRQKAGIKRIDCPTTVANNFCY